MAKKFDFSSINLKVIDININSNPDMYINQNNISFSRRVLEDMSYPAYVQYCLDAEQAVFAIRACKGNESRAVAFVKGQNEQSKVITIGNKNIHEVITRMIPEYQPKKRYKAVGHYDSENKIMYYDLREAVISNFFKEGKE